MLTVRSLDVETAHELLDGLAGILVECVEGGASVSFLLPFSLGEARAFFVRSIREAADGSRLLLAAFQDAELVGTVQVILALPPNQPHRAEIAKLLVSPKARGTGVGRALMREAEERARAAGKSLLVLDTCAGSAAEALYERLGWGRAGVIPGYALMPDGVTPCDTVIFWKKLERISF